MSNYHRGDITLNLADETYTLRLTLHSLAELEAAFGVADLAALGERIGSGRLSAQDLIRLAGAAIRGGGTPLTDAALAQKVDAREMPALITALGQLFALTFGGGGGDALPNPPPPQG
jgi:hypothetical protein